MNCECELNGPMCSDCESYWLDVAIHHEGDIEEEC